MQINIANIILDEDKLNKEIDDFEIVHKQQAYLFMNMETMEKLETFSNENTKPIGNGVLCLFNGRKVYKDNDLKFGEIEIR